MGCASLPPPNLGPPVMASTAFDPYYVWLGIPPAEQPPNRYRLLGIPLFEANPDVIDSAADRQAAHLRTFQSGQNGALTQPLLNEVAAARICLLNPQKKAAYDQSLQAGMSAGQVATGSAIGWAQPEQQSPSASTIGKREPSALPTASGSAVGMTSLQPGGSQIRRKPAPLPTAQPLPNATPLAASPAPDKWDGLIGDNKSATAGAAKSAKPNKAIRKSGPPYPLIGAATAILIAVGAAFVFLRAPADGVLTFDWPAADRAGAALTIDGQPVAIPETGPWEFRGPPGSHQIVAQRPAFKMQSSATITAGEPQSVAADWKPKAELIVTWPTAERAGATLTIDGRPQPPSSGASLELPLEPGRHVVRATRNGAEPFDATVTLVEDERHPLKIAMPLKPLLVVDLPADQRPDAALTIDGEPPPLDRSAATLEFRLKPGKHTIHITRPGFHPYDEVVTLEQADNKAVSPVWTPLAPSPNDTATTNEKKNPAATGNPTADSTADVTPPLVKKLAAPSPDEQAKIGKDLDSIYKVTHSLDKDTALVEEILKTANEPGTTLAERYMLLLKAAALSAELGDLDAAFHAIDTIDGAYEFDALAAKQKLLDESVKTTTGTNPLIALVAAAQTVTDQAIAADQFDAALATMAIAKKAIAKRPADAHLHRAANERLTHLKRVIAALQATYGGVADAKQTLAKKPDDAAANLTVGRWNCLLKNDWQHGLPLLAKSGDERLQPLAKAELAGNLDVKSQLQIADGWWDAAAKETDLAHDNARLHAAEIYQNVLPNLESPLKKIAIEQRLVDVATIKSGGSSSGAAPVAGGQLPRDQWVDLLQLANPAVDAVYGKWTRESGAIVCAPGQFTRLQLPVEVSGGYDLEVEFTRKTGSDEVVVILPIGSNYRIAMFGLFGGTASGLHQIDRHTVDDGNNTYSARPGALENGRYYRILVSVRVLPGDRSSIAVNFQGRPAWPEWSGPNSQLNELYGWRLSPRHVGFGAWESTVAFHSARLRVISGEATGSPRKGALPPTLVVKKASWGGGSNWADVTPRVLHAVRNNEWAWASPDFCQADPTPGWRKHLNITYDVAGKERSDSIDEGGAWKWWDVIK
jgi:hypothetical protein